MNSSTILSNVSRLIAHSKPQIRIASIWTIINLTWMDDRGAKDRVEKLKEFGICSILNNLTETEENSDVKERIKTALSNFGQGFSHSSERQGGSEDAMMIEPVVTQGGSESRRSDVLFGSIYDEDTGDFMRLSDH